LRNSTPKTDQLYPTYQEPSVILESVILFLGLMRADGADALCLKVMGSSTSDGEGKRRNKDNIVQEERSKRRPKKA